MPPIMVSRVAIQRTRERVQREINGLIERSSLRISNPAVEVERLHFYLVYVHNGEKGERRERETKREREREEREKRGVSTSPERN
jgi:hypothetical protein